MTCPLLWTSTSRVSNTFGLSGTISPSLNKTRSVASTQKGPNSYNCLAGLTIEAFRNNSESIQGRLKTPRPGFEYCRLRVEFRLLLRSPERRSLYSSGQDTSISSSAFRWSFGRAAYAHEEDQGHCRDAPGISGASRHTLRRRLVRPVPSTGQDDHSRRSGGPNRG